VLMTALKRPHVRMWEADSIITLLSKLDVEKLPTHESRAVSECQAAAMEKWLSAYADEQSGTKTPHRNSASADRRR
jgi:hypothetical protein